MSCRIWDRYSDNAHTNPSNYPWSHNGQHLPQFEKGRGYPVIPK
ncbi:hypothetical protein MOLA814_01688 [Betaproteobacteria bacterium MOLA814]|nr:hypothetical protein MOLA814_01688 [Betaproteobacteria bacterium MOLA814]